MLSPRGRRFLRLAGLLLSAAIVALLAGMLIARGGDALGDRSLGELTVPLLWTTAAWLVIPLVLAQAWIVLLADTTSIPRGARAPLLAAFLVSWAARYIPGKLPALGGRVYLAVGLGIAQRPLIAATATGAVLELLVATALGAGLVVVALGASSGGWGYAAGAILALLAVAGLHPRVSRPLLNRLLRRAGREPLRREELPGGRALLLASLLMIVAHLLSGATVLIVVAALTDIGRVDAIFIVGATALAGVIGIAASITPAGLGVREGAIAATLGSRVATGPPSHRSVRLWGCCRPSPTRSRGRDRREYRWCSSRTRSR